jgi:hypothetical protein
LKASKDKDNEESDKVKHELQEAEDNTAILSQLSSASQCCQILSEFIIPDLAQMVAEYASSFVPFLLLLLGVSCQPILIVSSSVLHFSFLFHQ